MSEKVVVIGGTSGMGLASAKLLHKYGYQVVITGREQNKVDEKCREIGAGVSGRILDFTDRKAINTFFKAEENLHHLVLVGAGPTAWGAFKDLRPLKLHKAFETKFWGYFHCAQVALTHLNQHGSITIFAGATGRCSMPNNSGLAAVNGAIISWAQTLAKEIGPIRVNTVSPGLIDTPVFDSMSNKDKEAIFTDFKRSAPINRVGQPEEVAQAVHFLISNLNVTGSVIDIDGGMRLY